jgi:hypothetical protein
MTPPIFSILSANGTVTALIGSNPVRCFPDMAPQTDAQTPIQRPYVVWSTVVGTAYNVMEGPPPGDHTRTSLQVYADTAASRDAVYEACRAALDPFGYMASLNFSGVDPDTKRFTISFDWNFILDH